MKVIYKLLVLALVTTVAVILILNPTYFAQQVKYWFGGVGESVVQNPNSDNTNTNPEKAEPNIVSIPSLDIKAPIQYSTESNEQAFQKALQNGVVHYPDTALIGQPGNVYIFGHSSDSAFADGKYKTVFALLPKVQNGAEIVLTDPSGLVYRYVVYDQFPAENTDVHLLDQNTDGRKILTLQTSYPIGTALKRYIVKAELKE